jgi:hypothetical protein
VDPTAQLHECGLQREIRHIRDYRFAGAVTLVFGADYYAEALPTRERRDDGCSYSNACTKAIRYPVAEGRQGVRGYKETNSRARLFATPTSTMFARSVSSERVVIVRFSIS